MYHHDDGSKTVMHGFEEKVGGIIRRRSLGMTKVHFEASPPESDTVIVPTPEEIAQFGGDDEVKTSDADTLLPFTTMETTTLRQFTIVGAQAIAEAFNYLRMNGDGELTLAYAYEDPENPDSSSTDQEYAALTDMLNGATQIVQETVDSEGTAGTTTGTVNAGFYM